VCTCGFMVVCVKTLLRQILEGTADVHRIGAAHRDLKVCVSCVSGSQARAILAA
jgi:serine/threonine protein kinase